MENELKIGQEVIISFDPKDHYTGNPARQFNGQTAIIKKKNHLKYGSRHSNYSILYELEGIESEFGIPYSFVADQLLPIKI